MEIEEILKDYITTTEAAKIYAVSPRTIRDLIYADKIEYVKVEWLTNKFKYMVSKSSLDRHYSRSVEGAIVRPAPAPQSTTYLKPKSLLQVVGEKFASTLLALSRIKK